MKQRHTAAVLLLTCCLFVLAAETPATSGKPGRHMPAYEYGSLEMVRIGDNSELPPALFRHWVHRAKHSCRLCHVDIGFSMEAGQTIITEEDNRQGRFCGACHNGREAFAPEEKNLVGKTRNNCDRCHSPVPLGHDTRIREHFDRLSGPLPSGRFGNEVDWAEATKTGKVKPKDFIEGVSFPRAKMKHEEGEVNLDAKLQGLPDIIFSHKEHAAWTGCELCHPDVFALKAGLTKFTMQDIFAGSYCGACHGNVAFPLQDCARCHSNPAM